MNNLSIIMERLPKTDVIVVVCDTVATAETAKLKYPHIHVTTPAAVKAREDIQWLVLLDNIGNYFELPAYKNARDNDAVVIMWDEP